jgi:BirA family transcriptional regulator, biotin operon repressor / biotin---[acetyl-CoA-carboxylase] ligase
MTFALGSAANAGAYRLEAFDSVGSTNALALDRARSGDPGRLWLAARRQEQGRGRRGRAWATPEGNLAATLLMVSNVPPPLAATLGFVAGLSLAVSLEAVAPAVRLSFAADGMGARNRFELKWPNDVLSGGGKIAGILLESLLLDNGRLAIAIGFGVNVVAHPADTPYPATSLRVLGSSATTETLFAALSDAWVENAARWDQGRGLASIRRLWLARAAGLGGEVAVRIDGAVVRGTFETIDEDCGFVIRASDGGRVRVMAGDVHFGAVASAGAI